MSKLMTKEEYDADQRRTKGVVLVVVVVAIVMCSMSSGLPCGW